MVNGQFETKLEEDPTDTGYEEVDFPSLVWDEWDEELATELDDSKNPHAIAALIFFGSAFALQMIGLLALWLAFG